MNQNTSPIQKDSQNLFLKSVKKHKASVKGNIFRFVANESNNPDFKYLPSEYCAAANSIRPKIPALTWQIWMASMESETTDIKAKSIMLADKSSRKPADFAHLQNPQKNSQYCKKRNRNMPTSSIRRAKGTIINAAKGLYLK